MKTLITLFVGGCLSFGSVLAQQEASSPVADGSYADLGRGLNLGNYLENPHPGDWKIKFASNDYVRIHQAGFTNIRMPLNWSAHTLAGSDYTIDPAYFQKVDENVEEARAAGLKIIIDDHNDREMMSNPDATMPRFLAIWKQVAEHYQGQPSIVLFELLNEPIEKMDAAHYNDLLAKTLPIVRASNPDRTIIVGGAWSYSDKALDALVLPESDHHLLVTFHYYNPLKFTHQGAAFVPGAQAWLGTTWTGTEAEKKDVTDTFDRVSAWATAHQRPIYLGEFGTYLKGPMDSRAAWTAFVARTAEAHNFSWSYYDYASGFGVCDAASKEWIPPLFNALIPKP